jgi:hypothetical protein
MPKLTIRKMSSIIVAIFSRTSRTAVIVSGLAVDVCVMTADYRIEVYGSCNRDSHLKTVPATQCPQEPESLHTCRLKRASGGHANHFKRSRISTAGCCALAPLSSAT